MLKNIVVLLGVCFAGLLAQTPQQTPVFRAGVDLVTVDVLVLDKKGRPVTDLTAADFTITAGGKVRRVVAADYVPAGPAPGAAPAPALDRLVPAASSNAGRAVAARTFLFIVDTDEIRSGEGGTAMDAVMAFIDRIGPGDLVGLVSLPTGTPRLDPGTNRAEIKKALGLIRGNSDRRNECLPTPGEATGILSHDDTAVEAYLQRLDGLGEKCRPWRLEPPERSAQLAIAQYRAHARNVLGTAAALANAMASMNGLKTLVLVSEGLVSDSDLADDLTRFGDALESSRVRFYSIHLDAPTIEASNKSSTIRTGLLDDRVGFDGMADAATFGGGEAFRAIASATVGLNRMDAELAGYYLLAFERDPVDKDRARLGLKVSVSRPDIDVRFRKNVTITRPAAPAAAASDARAAIGRLLNTPGTDSAIRLDAATYALPNPRPATDARVLVVTEIGNGPAMAAVGYEISDAAGKKVADAFDAPPRLVSIDADHQVYLVTVPLAAGQYHLKLGVLNGSGATGSLDHAFDVQAPGAGVRLSDVILGDDRSGALRPIARVSPDMSRVIVRVDVDGPSADLASARARLRVTRAGGVAPVVDQETSVREAGDPSLRRVIESIDLAGLSAGTYEIAITVTTPAGNATARRALIVEPRAPARQQD